jgi:hypothetical protein
MAGFRDDGGEPSGSLGTGNLGLGNCLQFLKETCYSLKLVLKTVNSTQKVLQNDVIYGMI